MYLLFTHDIIWRHVSSSPFWVSSQSPNAVKRQREGAEPLLPLSAGLVQRVSSVRGRGPNLTELTLEQGHCLERSGHKIIRYLHLGLDYTEVSDADGSKYPGKLIRTMFKRLSSSSGSRLPREVIRSMRLEEWAWICQITHEEQNKKTIIHNKAQRIACPCSRNGSGAFKGMNKTQVGRVYWCLQGVAWHGPGDMEKGPVIDFWMMLDFILGTKEITCEFKATEPLGPKQMQGNSWNQQFAKCGLWAPADPQDTLQGFMRYNNYYSDIKILL